MYMNPTPANGAQSCVYRPQVAYQSSVPSHRTGEALCGQFDSNPSKLTQCGTVPGEPRAQNPLQAAVQELTTLVQQLITMVQGLMTALSGQANEVTSAPGISGPPQTNGTAADASSASDTAQNAASSSADSQSSASKLLDELFKGVRKFLRPIFNEFGEKGLWKGVTSIFDTFKGVFGSILGAQKS